MEYHKPVLLTACVEGLKIDPEGVYVDATFGGGGHSKAILDKLTSGRLAGFDQDEDAHNNAFAHDNLVLIRQNFRYLKNSLRLYRMQPVHGILADLGVSSHQFDVADRGFSIRFDAELDMRMDRQGKLTAKTVVNEYAEAELLSIFRQYGELYNARKVVFHLVKARSQQAIETVEHLKAAIKRCIPAGKERQFLAQVFQALRIEVNDELGALKALLEQSVEVLAPGGRLVVIAYHSLEDRLVKHFIRAGNFEGTIEKDFFGNPIRPFKAVNSKVIKPTEEEIQENSRARSARLRIAEREA